MKKNIITIQGRDYKVYARKVRHAIIQYKNLPRTKNEIKKWYAMDGFGNQYHDGQNKNFGQGLDDQTAYYDYFIFHGREYAVEQFIACYGRYTGLYYDADDYSFHAISTSDYDGESIKVYYPIN